MPARPGTNGEFVVVGLTRLDRMERTAVRLERQMDAVPVDGGRLGEIVSEMNDDVIAFAHVESRPGNLSIVGKDFARNAGLQSKGSDRGGDFHLHRLRQPRDVEENRRVRRVALAGDSSGRSVRGYAIAVVWRGRRNE